MTDEERKLEAARAGVKPEGSQDKLNDRLSYFLEWVGTPAVPEDVSYQIRAAVALWREFRKRLTEAIR